MGRQVSEAGDGPSEAEEGPRRSKRAQERAKRAEEGPRGPERGPRELSITLRKPQNPKVSNNLRLLHVFWREQGGQEGPKRGLSGGGTDRPEIK